VNELDRADFTVNFAHSYFACDHWNNLLLLANLPHYYEKSLILVEIVRLEKAFISTLSLKQFLVMWEGKSAAMCETEYLFIRCLAYGV
jgi:hypothetical protein